VKFHLQQLGPEHHCKAKEWVKTYYDLEGLSFEPKVERGIETLLESSHLGRFWEVVMGSGPVGYIVLTFGFDHEFGGLMGLVTDFYLIESARGSGLGSAVLIEVMESARRVGCQHLELAVLDHNDRAAQFYQRLGFTPVLGRRMFEIELV
jgi:GNAT superfamily N-acetyltransferase